LHNVLAVWIREFSLRPALEKLDVELVHVVLEVPVRQVFVETVVPVRRGRHVSDLVFCNDLGNEVRNRVADEDIALFDMRPDPVPHASGRRTLLVREVSAHLDVAAVDNGALRVVLFGNVDELGHLGVVDDDHVCAAEGAGCEGAALLGPVAVGVLLAPLVEDADFVGLKRLASSLDALQDVVVVLGDAEDLRFRARNVPDAS
jgi:hypothetical protein